MLQAILTPCPLSSPSPLPKKEEHLVEDFSLVSEQPGELSAQQALQKAVEAVWVYFLERTGKHPAQYRLTKPRQVMGRKGFESLIAFAKRCKWEDPLASASELFRVAVDRLADSPSTTAKTMRAESISTGTSCLPVAGIRRHKSCWSGGSMIRGGLSEADRFKPGPILESERWRLRVAYAVEVVCALGQKDSMLLRSASGLVERSEPDRVHASRDSGSDRQTANRSPEPSSIWQHAR
jgi:hypothetical protein